MSAVEEGYRDAARVVRRRARNFAFAFVGQPAISRRALHAVYAFCREADDAADDGRGPEAARAALSELRRRLDAVYEGRPTLPRDLALQDAARRFGIARVDFAALLDGVERDLGPGRFETFEELYRYCYQVGASVGLLCLPIFGRSDEAARESAVELGIGMQLTNILRDVAEDAARDRIYLPLEELRRFGVEEGDVLAGREPSGTGSRGGGFAELLAFQVRRAAGYLERGRSLLPLLDPPQRFCPGVLATLYGELLERIREAGPAVLRGRTRLPTARKAWIAARVYATSRYGAGLLRAGREK